MRQQGVYLDYNATAPLRRQAAEAMVEAFSVAGNPSSVHGFGRAARRLVETAREAVAALVGAEPDQVVFTSGGTEANNLALSGPAGRPVLLSAGEHDSLLKAAPSAILVALDASGALDLEALEQALDQARETGAPPVLVSIMLANNETGVIQPLERVAELVHARGGRLHCDAVQAAGKLPLDKTRLGADLLSLSAHKLGGPMGVGALVADRDAGLTPLIRGGGQERRRRAGTENVAAIAGFGAAVLAARQDLAEGAEMPRLARLRDRMEDAVQAAAPAARLFGADAPRLPNTSCFTMPGVRAETQVMALDLAGIAVSAGAACSSGKVEPSHVLRAMGVGPLEAEQAIRVSLGWATREADISLFLEAWKALYVRRSAA